MQQGILEISYRSGQIARRVPVHEQTLTIGRAYDNDIVLDDPYVCPHHLQLSWQDNKLTARDLNSINGTFPAKSAEPLAEFVLGPGQALRIGHTLIRFRATSEPVQPTLVDQSATSLLRHFEKRWLAPVIFLLTSLWLLWERFLDTTTQVDGGKLVLGLITPLGFLLVWAGIWSFTNRMLAHRFNFVTHCAIACIGMVGISIYDGLFSLAGFAWGIDSLLYWPNWIGSIPVIALILYAHLRFASYAESARLRLAATSIAIGIVAFMLLPDHLGESDFSSSPDYAVNLKPPVFLMIEGNDSEAFFDSITDITKDLEQAVEEHRLDKLHSP